MPSARGSLDKKLPAITAITHVEKQSKTPDLASENPIAVAESCLQLTAV